MRGGLGSEESSMDRDSLDDYSADEMLVMATDNIQNELDNLNIRDEDEDPPKSLIVTNVDLSVFVDDLAKSEFESKFLVFEANAAFYYIRTFRRVRIDFTNHLVASAAKNKLDMGIVGNNTIHCYFIKVYGPSDPEEAYLQPPPVEKQFLISPPCSPPVGWEQPREGNPVVDYDLLAAMAQLAPGENHELHPSKSVTLCGNSISTPSIVVHVCGNSEVDQALGFGTFPATPGVKGKIIQTRCPERQNSLEDEA